MKDYGILIEKIKLVFIDLKCFSLKSISFLDLNIFVDDNAYFIIKMFQQAIRTGIWPVQELTVYGNEVIAKKFKAEFSMLQSVRTNTSDAWHKIEYNDKRVVWYFRDNHSLQEEINFALYEKDGKKLTLVSNAEELYGKKQLSVMIASLLLVAGPYLHVHGSAASVFGNGVLFIGKNRAGKSTLLREIISNYSADLVPLTDNATILTPTGEFKFVESSFSSELRLPDVPETREVIAKLSDMSKSAITFYTRNGKLRLSLSSIRKIIASKSPLEIPLKILVFINRYSEVRTKVTLEEINPYKAVSYWRSVMDTEWIEFWSIIPGLEQLVDIQAEYAMKIFSRKDIKLYHLTLPNVGNELVGLKKVFSILNRRNHES